jgi:pimeloyl-ACP methyl ester carboxylesterase
MLTVFATCGIHLINRFISATAELGDKLSTDNGKMYETKNGLIYYTKNGTGSPVLLIHNLDPRSSSYEWCRIIKKLEKQHTVYAVDLLGCGRSDKPYLTYTNYLYVQILTDFIRNVIKGAPDVICSQNSSSFVILAENMNPGLFHGIIAINPPAAGTFDQIHTTCTNVKKILLELPILGTCIYNIKTNKKKIAEMMTEDVFYKPHLVSSKMIDAYYEGAHKHLSHGRYLLASIEGKYIDNAVSHAVKNITIPFSIIESRTNKNALSIVKSYTSLNRSVETTYLSNTGLLPQLESPDKLLHAIEMLTSAAS